MRGFNPDRRSPAARHDANGIGQVAVGHGQQARAAPAMSLQSPVRHVDPLAEDLEQVALGHRRGYGGSA